jgi:hypothetical protein
MNKSVSEMLALYAPDTTSFGRTQHYNNSKDYYCSVEYYNKQQSYIKENQENLDNNKEHQKYLKQKLIEKIKFIKKTDELVKRHKDKLIKRQIQLESELKIGSQDWVNVRVPGKEHGYHTKLIFPFPGLLDGNFDIWDNQCLSYALIPNPKNPLNARLSDGSIVPISLRSNSKKSHNFAVTATKQSVFHFENNKKKQIHKKKKHYNDAPDHGNVNIEHIINGTVQICVIANINELIGNGKTKYILYWLAHPDNAILLYLTGVLNGLISDKINDDDDDFSFDRESQFQDIVGETPIQRLIFLLSNIEILKSKINKLRCNNTLDDDDNEEIKESEESKIEEIDKIDSNEISEISENNKIDENKYIEHLKQQLQNNNLLCTTWINYCSGCPTIPFEENRRVPSEERSSPSFLIPSELENRRVPADFINYIFSEEGDEQLNYILDNYNLIIDSMSKNKLIESENINKNEPVINELKINELEINEPEINKPIDFSEENTQTMRKKSENFLLNEPMDFSEENTQATLSKKSEDFLLNEPVKKDNKKDKKSRKFIPEKSNKKKNRK